jgi:hypothetical protein
LATAIAGAAGGNVTGTVDSLIQNTAIYALQSLAVTQVKRIADGFGTKDAAGNFVPTGQSEVVRGLLQGFVGCAGAAAANGSCSSGAAGAAGSVALNNLITLLLEPERKDPTTGRILPRSLDEQQARAQLIATLTGALVGALGGNANDASVAGQVETENNQNCAQDFCTGLVRPKTKEEYEKAKREEEEFLKTERGKAQLKAYGNITKLRECAGNRNLPGCATSEAKYRRLLGDIQAEELNSLYVKNQAHITITELINNAPDIDPVIRAKILDDYSSGKISRAKALEQTFAASTGTNLELGKFASENATTLAAFDAVLSRAAPLTVIADLSVTGGLTAYQIEQESKIKAFEESVASAQATASLQAKLLIETSAYGKLKNAKAGTVFIHLTTTEGAANGIATGGIKTERLTPDNRFGTAFYVGSSVQTSTAELEAHNASPKAGIVFVLNEKVAKILDLTDPATAQKYGYTGNPSTSAYSESQRIADLAKKEGYNVIKYNSVRDPSGVNLAILGNHNDVLKPHTVFTSAAPTAPRTPRSPRPPRPRRP